MPSLPPNRFLLTIAVMSATFLQVLDTTIVNVALPHMAGELSATPDQISWVLTTYLVATGVVLPLTGYLTDRMGQKRLLLISIFGFVVTSGFCGVAGSLAEIVTFRVLQGLFGAALIPLSQSIMLQAFSLSERGRAMAIWGVGIMVGPILGPTLGGYLTEALSWRWTFFINLPIGLLSLLLAWRTVPDSPRRERPLDWRGLALMFVAIGGLQFVIDRGNREDWFNSGLIQIVSIASGAAMLGFIYHSLTHRRQTLLDLGIFRDRNFTSACVLLVIFSFGLFSAIMLQPLMLEGLLGYPASIAGWFMAPRGVASMISMVIVGRLINHVSPRVLVVIGIVFGVIGSSAMTRYSLDVNAWFLIWPALLQGLAVGLVFVPLGTVAYATLPRELTPEAAGIYNLIRTMGTSVGISIAATIMARESQVAWSEAGSHIQPFNGALYDYFARLGLNPTDPQAPAMLARELARQAQMIGILDAFVAIAWSFVCMLPFVFLLRPGLLNRQAGSPPLAAE